MPPLLRALLSVVVPFSVVMAARLLCYGLQYRFMLHILLVFYLPLVAVCVLLNVLFGMANEIRALTGPAPDPSKEKSD